MTVTAPRGRKVVVALVVVGLALAGTAAFAGVRLLLPPAGGDPLVLLLLGSDEGPMRGPDPRTGRADGFQLLFVSGDRKHATFVSVPRDSYVSVPGHGTTRINACLVRGPRNCVATVEDEFGIEVDGYLLTSMHAFARGVRAFGGLRIDVPTPVRDGGHPIERAGPQKLTGMQALAYARDRKNRPGGDFTRTQAQAQLLARAHADVHAAGDVRAVVTAAAIVRRHTVTDLDEAELVHLAFQAMRLKPKNVQRVLAPGTEGRAGAAAIVRLRPRAYELIRDAADDGRVGG